MSVLLRKRLLPATLLLVCPPAALSLWTVATKLDGSVAAVFTREGWRSLLQGLPRPSFVALGMLLFFSAFELALLRLLPGRVFLGPVTPAGRRPQYRLNGVLAFAVTHLVLLIAWMAGLSPAFIYDRLGELLATSCLVALGLCGYICIRGRRGPSSADSGTTGSAIVDFFWGTSLHPQLFGVDLKQLCNCRISMMGWGVLNVAFLAKQFALDGRIANSLAIAAGLQLAYIFKFFVWESGYFTSIDIVHDRFGFYIGWGVLCWLPALYPIAPLYLVTHPIDLSPISFVALLVVGSIALLINYLADEQRRRVRLANGQLSVWGRPARCIEARYRAEDQSEHRSLLLACGYWGLSRHFHYLPELLLAFVWTLPCGLSYLLPYSYPLFLTVLLVDRVGRIDRRCQQKYGPHWNAYRELVPYKLIPGVY